MLEDRTYVTKAQWNEGVRANPEDPAGSRRILPSGADPHQIRKTWCGCPVPSQDERAEAVRGAPRAPVVPEAETMPLPKDPGDDAGRKKAVKAWLQGLPVYTEKHP